MSTGIVLHSGGPTPVVNASLLGVVEEARRHPQITGLLGARFGIAGLLAEDFGDLFALRPERLAAMARTPSSALGTSRHFTEERDVERLLKILAARDVRFLLIAGGNGSMGAAARIAAGAGHRGQELSVVGIPKTIDNDLAETDHSPGYASAARFFASAVRDIGADNRALPGQVEFVEVLGRNTGWLVAATALARRGAQDSDDAPHLIYFPEMPLAREQLLDDVDRVFRRLGRCVVAVCEGQLDEEGRPFGADVRAGSGGTLAMNLAHRLALLATEKLKLRARSEKPGLLGRSSSACFSKLDWDEARLCGQAAVRAAIAGESGVMITLERRPGRDYAAHCGTAPLEVVAAGAKIFPAAWRNAPEFLRYAAPLVGEIEYYSAI